ncbi:MAG: hypothetical protein ACJ79K_09780 [Gemmatimonadaceae bacterium]
MIRHPVRLTVLLAGALSAIAGRATAQGFALPPGAVSVVIADADHRVDTGLGLERAQGFLFGGQLDIEPSSTVLVTLRGLGGTLDADRRTPNAESRGAGELSLTTRVDVLPWLRGTATALGRSYEGALARQHWSELAFGGEGHLPLIDGILDGSLGLGLAPLVKVTGRAGPDLAIIGSARLRHAGERLDVALAYSLERYDFPSAGGVRRAEEVSMLVLRAGVHIGAARSAVKGSAH